MAEIVTRPATQQYREGWERAFGKQAAHDTGADKVRAQALPPRSTSVSANSPESPNPAKVDGSGLPALFAIQVKCPACGAQPYEDCYTTMPIYDAGSHIHDARRKFASEARAN